MENFSDFSITDGNCTNYTVGHFNATFPRNNNNKFMVLNFNIQCFNAKIDEFSAFLDEINLNPEIIVLTETWFSPSSCKDISGYEAYHCTRSVGNHRGGISIYVRENLNSSVTHFSFNVSPELEHVHVTLKSNNANLKKN